MKAARCGTGYHLAVIAMAIVALVIIASNIQCKPKPPTRMWQKAQFHSMDAAIDLFQHELGSYPPSDANDPEGKPYCGAMKLCEAMMGRDLLGFHPRSVFKQDATDIEGNRVYLPTQDNLRQRMGPYLPLGSASAIMLSDIYGKGNTGPFPEDMYVLCDVFKQKRPSGEKTGMPILHYRADPNGTVHDPCWPDNPANIYDYRDNQAILELAVPGKPSVKHPLADPKWFYEVTRSHKIKSPVRPYKANSYILISAGKDGLYGTDDDVLFDWRPPARRRPD